VCLSSIYTTVCTDCWYGAVAGENSIIIVGGANQAWPDSLPGETQEVGEVITAWGGSITTASPPYIPLHTALPENLGEMRRSP
jgi:hypothetical protein